MTLHFIESMTFRDGSEYILCHCGNEYRIGKEYNDHLQGLRKRR